MKKDKLALIAGVFLLAGVSNGCKTLDNPRAKATSDFIAYNTVGSFASVLGEEAAREFLEGGQNKRYQERVKPQREKTYEERMSDYYRLYKKGVITEEQYVAVVNGMIEEAKQKLNK